MGRLWCDVGGKDGETGGMDGVTEWMDDETMV